MKSGLFDEIYVRPAFGNDGAALGAALYRASLLGEVHNDRFSVPLLGPEYSRSAVEALLEGVAGGVKVKRWNNMLEICEDAARQIAQGRVIAWYRGRMEYGPRALGNRSVLAEPRRPQMRDRINAMVKKRESFRPFAPAVTIEQVDRWFDVAPMTAVRYMTFTVEVCEEHRAALAAITHVNGSVNTSFNMKGQPIVNGPAEAVETFIGTDMDALFLESIRVERKAPQ
jgi:carbamoyltransferase